MTSPPPPSRVSPVNVLSRKEFSCHYIRLPLTFLGSALSLSLSTHWISSPNPLLWKSASSSALRPRSLGCSPNTLFSAGAELSPPQPSPVVAVAVAGGFMSLMLFIVPDSIRMHPARWPSHELLMSQRAARPGFLLHSSDVFFEGRRNDDSTIRGTLSGTRARSFRSATLF